MDIMLASDLHIEFLPSLHSVIPENVLYKHPDVLVLAGDIDGHPYLEYSLEEFCELFMDSMIIYTPGNHEFYTDDGLTKEEIDKKIKDIEYKLNLKGYKFKVLQNESFTYEGIHFYGGTMWSDINVDKPEVANGDSFNIRTDLSSEYDVDVCRAYWSKFKDGLDEHLDKYGTENTVVISHFSPSIQFNNPFVPDSELTYYFCASMDAYLEMPIKAWLYGHTHYSMREVMPNGCVVMSAQGGYHFANESNRSFQSLII